MTSIYAGGLWKRLNSRVDSLWGIDQCQYPRTHCNYKKYMDIEFMSSNLLKKFVTFSSLKR